VLLTILIMSIVTIDLPNGLTDGIVSSVYGTIIYDPVESWGLISIKYVFNQKVSNTTVELPLITDSIGYIINVTDDYGNVLTYSFNPGNNTVTVLIIGVATSSVEVVYEVTDLFKEVSIQVYQAVFDLSIFENIPVNIEITIPGVYSVVSIPEAIVVTNGNTTSITLDKADTYAITVYYLPSTKIIGGVERTETSTMPSQETTPYATQSTPMETPLKPSTSSPIVVSEEKPILSYIVIIVILAVIIVAILYFVKRK